MLKSYLNVSPEEQKKRLLDRVVTEEKHWKHKNGDWNTREKFDDYIWTNCFRAVRAVSPLTLVAGSSNNF